MFALTEFDWLYIVISYLNKFYPNCLDTKIFRIKKFAKNRKIAFSQLLG